MTAKLRSIWDKIRKPLGIIGIIAACIGVVVLVFVVVRLYGTGFVGKTLWDWFGLLAALAIPVVVGFGAAWFTAQQGKVSNRENKDNQREAALKEYIDKMSELLLHENLRKSEPKGEVRKIARVLTLTVLQRLDGKRKRSVLQFLHEADLIVKYEPIVNLADADLQGTILHTVNLREADLDGVNLCGADLLMTKLRCTTLQGANLSRANMRRAFLLDANLSEADLRGANLSGADLRGADLEEAKLDDLDKTDLSKIFRVEDLSKPRKRLTCGTIRLIKTYHAVLPILPVNNCKKSSQF